MRLSAGWRRVNSMPRARGMARNRAGVMIATVASLLAFGAGTAMAGPQPGLPTTIDDYFQAGTQPAGLVVDIVGASNCFFCHAEYDLDAEPYRPWAASMMGQSARDPMFWACLTVANQDADEVGSFCIRCHVPNAFLEGRAS